MEKVLAQAQLLAQTILESEEYVNMHQAEEAAMKDEKATLLIAAYQEKRRRVEDLLSTPNMEKGDLAAAGEELENVENAIDENEVLNRVRTTSAVFSAMMEQVNHIIRYVVTGEEEEEHECGGSCGSCSGCGHHC